MHTQQKYDEAVGKSFQKRKSFMQSLRLFFFSGALLASGASLAQEPASTAAAQMTPSPMSGHMLQTTLILLFILGLLLGLVWLLKRAGVGTGQRRGGFYKVLAISALGPRDKIVLVEVGETWLVLGMTSNSINTLHSMPAGSIELEKAGNPAASFAKLLERVKTGKVQSR